jgi:hypothetical protein
LVYRLKLAFGGFSGHYFGCRWQILVRIEIATGNFGAWFLPAASPTSW